MTQAGASARNIFNNDRVLLFILSFIGLYIEIMLIRHVSSEIRIFAYFKNLVLVASFLGLGIGYLYKPKLSLMVTLVCISLLAVFTHPVLGFGKASEYLSFSDFHMWGAGGGAMHNLLIGLVMLSIVFFTILVSMVPIGQGLAEIFDRSENRIVDYSINIFASIGGIWTFAWISFNMFSPLAWYLAVIAIMLGVWRWSKKEYLLIFALTLVTCLSLYRSGDLKSGITTWSPYQKITFKEKSGVYKDGSETKSIKFHMLQTNNTLYLYLLNLSARIRHDHPKIFPPKTDLYFYYDLPYNFTEKTDDVLILGAGGGNDVAGALRAGAKHVTAVEIDPYIIAIGEKYHPEKPYSSKKVTVINNDARNYLRETKKKFDLIILGLLDSHTLTSNFSNTNLDSFMYTRESIGDMRKRLKDDGVLAISFQVSHDWLGTKIYRIIEKEFGRLPIVIGTPSNSGFIRGTGGTYFIAGNNQALLDNKFQADTYLKNLKKSSDEQLNFFNNDKIEIPTDDWPYLYAESKTVPRLHILVSVLLLGIFLFVYLRYFGSPSGTDIHFAALGAGFLLLEVSVISRFALFWGATWIVSSIVITLILFAILLANGLFIKLKKQVPYPVIYVALAFSLIAIYLTPLQSYSVVALYLAPFTLIGYLFAQSFSLAPTGSRALGYNLFGALIGGLSESFSFVYGLSGLILISIGFYFVSFIFSRRSG